MVAGKSAIDARSHQSTPAKVSKPNNEVFAADVDMRTDEFRASNSHGTFTNKNSTGLDKSSQNRASQHWNHQLQYPHLNNQMFPNGNFC